jgi:hypothetical protein
MEPVKKIKLGERRSYIFKRRCFNLVCRYTNINLLYIPSSRIPNLFLRHTQMEFESNC